MNKFLILIVLLTSVTTLANDKYALLESFIGSYKVVSEFCWENGQPAQSDGSFVGLELTKVTSFAGKPGEYIRYHELKNPSVLWYAYVGHETNAGWDGVAGTWFSETLGNPSFYTQRRFEKVDHQFLLSRTFIYKYSTGTNFEWNCKATMEKI